ncbi:hypothetical protein M9Y10_006743 [Tritrichomonas musculus]|uniref:Phosphotyrosine protein phosphatase I domain-containing protein n=1 Tax=Tritrichomonas musculus TaxID=1915356 RepID=A0ABR2JFX0_9EUKA
MTRIMFVCHGNICRSPMAEFVMKDLVKKKHVEPSFTIASSATSTEELGNPVYPPAKAELKKHGISCEGKCAVQLKSSDYDKYDIFAVMDDNNLRNIKYIFPSDPKKKIHKLLEFANRKDDIADPWYRGNFDKTYQDICEGCNGLLEYILKDKK